MSLIIYGLTYSDSFSSTSILTTGENNSQIWDITTDRVEINIKYNLKKQDNSIIISCTQNVKHTKTNNLTNTNTVEQGESKNDGILIDIETVKDDYDINTIEPIHFNYSNGAILIFDNQNDADQIIKEINKKRIIEDNNTDTLKQTSYIQFTYTLLTETNLKSCCINCCGILVLLGYVSKGKTIVLNKDEDGYIKGYLEAPDENNQCPDEWLKCPQDEGESMIKLLANRNKKK